MSNANLYAVLRSQFPTDLNRIAIETDSGLNYSWSDIDLASAMLANLLADLNCPLGSRIAVQVEKSVEAVLLYLACLRAGLVFVPLNTAYKSAEIEYFIGNAKPAVVVCSPENFSWVARIAFQSGVSSVFTLDTNRGGSLLERATHGRTEHNIALCGEHDSAAILYTSGTTGQSKGALLTHGNLSSNALVLKDYWGWREGDILLHTLPIFHVHGLFVALHGALINGSKILWFAKFDPRATIAAFARSSVFMGVPTHYTRMLAEPLLTHQAVANMRLFISGSAPLLKESHLEWEQRTGHKILERYGMSETLMLTSNPYHKDPRYQGQSDRKAGSVGFALPGVSLRICGEDGRVLPAGQTGAIQVRGPNVFAGYWQMPEKTAAEFSPDGYFKTGDVGLQDDQGYIHIVGRSKDLIISGGYNIYPVEVEGFINQLSGVFESAVVGVPDADFGEVGAAFVVAKPGQTLQPTEVLSALKAILASFKTPKYCAVVAELPRNAMGKVDKKQLRINAIAAAMLPESFDRIEPPGPI